MKYIKSFTVIIFFTFTIGSPCLAASFEEGVQAYRTGNFEEAISIWKELAEEGGVLAQYRLGLMYEIGKGVNQDFSEAAKWYREAAEQGNVTSQFNLGHMYHRGIGVPQLYDEAVRWYRMAAEQGSVDAQVRLGALYENGEGISQDSSEASKWYRMAAEQGDATAQFSLGVMYGKGEGVPQDDAQAVRWYRMAAEQGHGSAMNNLGVFSRNGRGIDRDDREAVKLFRAAGENGNDLGWANLGYMYEHGRGGLKVDLFKALELYEKAANNPWAEEQYQRLNRQIECAEIAVTELFGENLLCADRDTLRAAVQQAGAIAIVEDKNKWGDTYNSKSILSGTSELYIGYTYDDLFAVAQYTFPAFMDKEKVVKVKEMVQSKYGAPQHSSGNPNLGEAAYRWNLEDGIELKVSRGWPDTTTYLTFYHPENYQAMRNKQEEIKKQKEAEKYESESNAF